MRTDQNPPGFPDADFSALHPALMALETIMGVQKEALDRANRASELVHLEANKIDPTTWTTRIEAARDNPEERAKLKALYEEQALCFMSTFLQWEITRSRYMEGKSTISDAIVDLLIVHDAIGDRSKDAFLKPLMRARILTAAEVHAAEFEKWYNPLGSDPLAKIAYPILVKAFRKLESGVPELVRARRPYFPCLSIGGSICESDSGIDRSINLMRAAPVAFVDCVNSTHPASAKLAELVVTVKDLWKKTRQLTRTHKDEQNGGINETQHARRLVDFLLDDEPDVQLKEAILGRQVESQDVRRLEYERHRQRLHIQIRAFEEALQELSDTLKESVEETTALLAEVTEDARSTIDRLLTVRIMMNNCLAAEITLRAYVPELAQSIQILDKDLSHGAGRKALDAEFEEARKHYDFSLKRRQEAEQPSEGS